MDLANAHRVAVLAAMVPELQPIVRALSLRPVGLEGVVRAYAGRAARCEVVAAVTTMGTSAAAAATSRLLDAHAVDHVIMVGVCGGIDRRFSIGDLVVPAAVLDEATGAVHRPTPLGDAVPAGTLLTTDLLHGDAATIAGFAARGIVALDMETAAVAAVSEARGIPWSVFRSISDWAGDPDVDAELLAMSRADGTPNPRAIVRFVVRHPRRIAKLARLGAGLRRAVQSSTTPVLAALSLAGPHG